MVISSFRVHNITYKYFTQRKWLLENSTGLGFKQLQLFKSFLLLSTGICICGC